MAWLAARGVLNEMCVRLVSVWSYLRFISVNLSYSSYFLVTLVAQIAGMNSVEISVYSEARESNEVNMNATTTTTFTNLCQYFLDVKQHL